MQPVLEATTRSLAGSSGRAAAVRSSRAASALQPSWSSCRRFRNRRQLIRFAGRSGLSAEAVAGDGERRASSLPAASATMNSSWEMSEDVEVRSATQQERVGVLLLNLGGPENLDDVQPFLYNLFADPDIIRLPAPIRFLQPALATLISTLRAPKSKEGYAAIGGGSPLRRVTDEQAEALRVSLDKKGKQAKVYVAMRYWKPFTEDTLEDIKRDRITHLVVLPLYPQFSISTSGSSLRLLEQYFRSDSYLRYMKHTVIPSWYQRRGYVTAMADLCQQELERATFDRKEDATFFFSAHGVPSSYVTDAGDPYKEEIEQCVTLITDELRRRKLMNPWRLAYQSRVGPVEWLQPYTDTTIREMGASGVHAMVAVPISFVSEHIETLEEIDCEYRELAHESGIPGWARVPALGLNEVFIDDLADAVLEALPYVGSVAQAQAAGLYPSGLDSLVPLGSVEDLLDTYDRKRLELPSPIVVWQWGWTRSAEILNGRIAMISTMLLLGWEFSTGTGVLHLLGILRS